ncbi:MAG: GldG family protein [Treponema sp.]|nr:GldG family protein [Treponema sp.]
MATNMEENNTESQIEAAAGRTDGQNAPGTGSQNGGQSRADDSARSAHRDKGGQNAFLRWLKNPAGDTALFIIAIILLNLVASRAFLRWDLTKSKSYSLSPASKELVRTVEEPLDIKVFFSRNLPSPYSTVYQYVTDILSEYKGASKGRLTYELYDMEDSENQALARKYGISQVQIQEIADNEVGFKSAYMGMAFSYADQMEKLDGLTDTDGLEYKISQTIGKIISNTNALSGLADDVTVTLYRSKKLSEFGISGFDEMDKMVQDAFGTVNAKFQNRMSFSIQDPAPEEAESLSQRYGIQVVEWKDDRGGTERGSLGLVVEAGDKFRTVPLQMVSMIFAYAVSGLDDLEENLTASVKALASKSAKIAYVTNHGELALADAQNGAANFAGLVNGSYTLEDLDLSKKDIPGGVQTLMINGPKTAFSEGELYKVDQFLMRGGNLMLFLDPFDAQSNPYTGETNYVKIETGLERLLAKYGIKAESAYVLDEDCYTQSTQQYGNLKFYYAPVLSDKSLNQKNAISANLGYVIFLMPGAIDTSEAAAKADEKVTVLASSSPKSWTMADNVMLSPFTVSPPADKSGMKSYEMAVLVEGKFESAFDSKPAEPVAATDGGSTDGAVATDGAALPQGGAAADATSSADGSVSLSGENHTPKSLQEGKILLIPTSYVTSPQILQADSDAPVAKLLQNAVDYMNGNGDLCSMRTKGLSLSTLRLSSGPLVYFAKYFNIIGLAVIVALIGLFALLSRGAHRKEIRLRYDADDEREVSK